MKDPLVACRGLCVECKDVGDQYAHQGETQHKKMSERTQLLGAGHQCWITVLNLIWYSTKRLQVMNEESKCSFLR